MRSQPHILMYCQHLSGTGHFVRSHELARAIHRRHDVVLTDGGRPVPRRSEEHVPRLLALPRITRTDRKIASLDGSTSSQRIMAERAAVLADHLKSRPADLLMIEHFPFSKWELAGEITGLIDIARQVNPSVKVVCSRRDIIAPSRFDIDDAAHADRAVRMLNEHFSAVLVHTDPSLVRMQEYTPWADRINIAIHDTGYVAESPADQPDVTGLFNDTRPIIAVSEGGAGDGTLGRLCREAWQLLAGDAQVRGHRMVIFSPPDKGDSPSATNRPMNADAAIEHHPFSADFLPILQRSALSISHAGYNTCTNLLVTGVRSILMPNAKMSDQIARASRLAERGLARVVPPDAAQLAQAIRTSLAAPPPRHTIDLHGAEHTAAIVEQLLSQTPVH